MTNCNLFVLMFVSCLIIKKIQKSPAHNQLLKLRGLKREKTNGSKITNKRFLDDIEENVKKNQKQMKMLIF